MSIIISGFPGIGKTHLCKKYKNVIDLESSKYQYCLDCSHDIETTKGTKRKKNPKWPKNYIDAIMSNRENYDIIFVSIDPLVHDQLRQHNLKFVICYPDLSEKEIYLKRYSDRKNNHEFIHFMARNFEYILAKAKHYCEEKWVLKHDQTLEDMLKKHNYPLSPHDME